MHNLPPRFLGKIPINIKGAFSNWVAFTFPFIPIRIKSTFLSFKNPDLKFTTLLKLICKIREYFGLCYIESIEKEYWLSLNSRQHQFYELVSFAYFSEVS